MKKIFITTVIACFSVISFAQPASETEPVIIDTITAKTGSMDRISKLENDVKELKASNELLQKQVAGLKQQLQVKKKKVSVSRTGSKQPVWVEE